MSGGRWAVFFWRGGSVSVYFFRVLFAVYLCLHWPLDVVFLSEGHMRRSGTRYICIADEG